MSVNNRTEAKPARVHRVEPRGSKAEATAEEAAAPVARAIPLEELEETQPVVQAVEEDDDEEFTLDGDDNPTGSGVAEDDDDDSDLSLLEETGTDGKASIHADHDEPEEGFLEIYSENCLSCKSLIPFATKKNKSCHFSAGNKNCPAQSTQIVVRVPIEDIVPRFLSAETQRDFGRLAKLNAKLAEFPEWYQQRVASALEDARAKRS